ncbi:MAG: hypothetical protein ACYC41_06450 [Bacillota bacterium]
MDDGTGKDDLVADLPWPKPGPALLGPDGDWWNNAVLNPTAAEWRIYAEGYARGAEILVRHVVDGNRDQDVLVYPIVFLYRHHLELALKDLIRRASDLLGRKLPPRDRNNPLYRHDLDRLWKLAKTLLKDVWPEGDEETLVVVEQRITELAAVDKSSISFRYPENQDVDTTPSLPLDLTHINIRTLGEVMAEIVEFLSACRLGISSMKEARDEYERDMRSEYENGGF